MPATLVITGGIGSGKSLVCRMLAAKGVPVYDSDSAAKSLYDSDARLREAVVSLFGDGVLASDGKIDRKALGSLVFSDPAALKALEALVHPAVYRDFEIWRASQTCALVAYESALALQDALPPSLADEYIYVDAARGLRVERASRRDGRAKDETEARADLQSGDASDPRITYILENNGTETQLAEKVDALYEKMKLKYENRSC